MSIFVYIIAVPQCCCPSISGPSKKNPNKIKKVSTLDLKLLLIMSTLYRMAVWVLIHRLTIRQTYARPTAFIHEIVMNS